MATVDRPFPILKLPIEVRWVIYRQLLSNLSVHPCPSNARPGEIYDSVQHPRNPEKWDVQTFMTQTMDCASQYHGRSLWRSICLPNYQYEPFDLLNLMLASTQVHLELEPLIWTNINFVVGLLQFLVLFRQILGVPIRNGFTEARSRHQVLQKLTLVLPRKDELFANWSRAPMYRGFDAHLYARDVIERALTCLTTEFSELRSVTFFMDASELRPDAEAIIPFPYAYVDWILRFRKLRHCTFSYSGVSMNPEAGYVSRLYRKQLDICEQVLLEMVTGIAPDISEDFLAQPTERITFRNDEEKPVVKEYIGRVIRCHEQWWTSLSVQEREALHRDEAEKKGLREQARQVERWMLANQI